MPIDPRKFPTSQPERSASNDADLARRVARLENNMSGVSGSGTVGINYTGAISVGAPTPLPSGTAFNIARTGVYRALMWQTAYHPTGTASGSILGYVDAVLYGTLPFYFNNALEHHDMGNHTFQVTMTKGVHYWWAGTFGPSTDTNDHGGVLFIPTF